MQYHVNNPEVKKRRRFIKRKIWVKKQNKLKATPINAVYNYSKITLTEPIKKLLNRGLNFCVAPLKLKLAQTITKFNKFERSFLWKEWWAGRQDENFDPKKPKLFKKKTQHFHPKRVMKLEHLGTTQWIIAIECWIENWEVFDFIYFDLHPPYQPLHPIQFHSENSTWGPPQDPHDWHSLHGLLTWAKKGWAIIHHSSMVSMTACYCVGHGFKSWQGRELLILNIKEFIIWIWNVTWYFQSMCSA